jgi:hypothetical protein
MAADVHVNTASKLSGSQFKILAIAAQPHNKQLSEGETQYLTFLLISVFDKPNISSHTNPSTL